LEAHFNPGKSKFPMVNHHWQFDFPSSKKEFHQVNKFLADLVVKPEQRKGEFPFTCSIWKNSCC
jgi:hypothetical protein